jgi:hypothetical protein
MSSVMKLTGDHWTRIGDIFTGYVSLYMDKNHLPYITYDYYKEDKYSIMKLDE